MLLYGHSAPASTTCPLDRRRRGGDRSGVGGRVRVDVLGGMGARLDDYEGLGGPGCTRCWSASARVAACSTPAAPPASCPPCTSATTASPASSRGACCLVGRRAGGAVDTGAVDRGHGRGRPGERGRQPRLIGGAQPQHEALPLAIAAGLATTYPEALLALGQVLTPAGSAMLDQWNSLCFDAEVDIPGPYLSADLATVEPFASLMEQNTAGTVATARTPLDHPRRRRRTRPARTERGAAHPTLCRWTDGRATGCHRPEPLEHLLGVAGRRRRLARPEWPTDR